MFIYFITHSSKISDILKTSHQVQTIIIHIYYEPFYAFLTYCQIYKNDVLRSTERMMGRDVLNFKETIYNLFNKTILSQASVKIVPSRI